MSPTFTLNKVIIVHKLEVFNQKIYFTQKNFCNKEILVIYDKKRENCAKTVENAIDFFIKDYLDCL